MRRRRIVARLWIVAIALGALPLLSDGWRRFARWNEPKPDYLGYPVAPAQRIDLHAMVQLGGDLSVTEKTLIECKIDTGLSGLAGSSGRGGMTTLIEVVPDGSVVEKGDVLARLDASDYEEMVRQFEIYHGQAASEARSTQYDVEVAEISLKQYRDGELEQRRQDCEGRRALYDSDTQRQRERVAWARRMLVNNYISEGQLLQEQAILERSEISLNLVIHELETLNKYAAPMQIKRLESALDRARLEHGFAVEALALRGKQLQAYRDQVDACTIRAPHAGRVIYANIYNPRMRIERGATVFNRMPLFYLPDLARLEVEAEIPEAMITRVQAGQPASVVLGGFPDRWLDAHVRSVDPLPREPKSWKTSREVRNFLAKIALDTPLPGALPGMSADVRIATGVRPQVLVVPSSAVAIAAGLSYVYLPHPDHIERRQVDVADGDQQFIEVRSGLTEGELVLANPIALDVHDIRDSQGRPIDQSL